MTDFHRKMIALQLVPGIGNVYLKRLISYVGNLDKIFESNSEQLLKIPGIRKPTVDSIIKRATFSQADKIIKSCDQSGVQIICYSDSQYPNRLNDLHDAPAVLYFKGNAELNSTRMISVVGTRRATEYGKRIVQEIINSLAHHSVSTVSGLAYGIDASCHKYSLEQNLTTIGVMASGHNYIYPPEHLKMAERMLEYGGLLSEHPPSVVPDAHLFPVRNRIIAGISDATIVVEAAEKGGALITANISDSYGRPVFAVPGDIGNRYSEGCNQLIRDQKALIYTDISDLSYHLNWNLESKKSKPKLNLNQLAPEQQMVVKKLLQYSQKGLPIDDLAWQTNMQLNQLSSVLLTLEFQGIVKSLPGKKYRLS